jgi:(+)-trans-carveol dehydrogenase
VFNTLGVTVPAMRAAGNGGSIIVTASPAALRFGLHLGDYAATKAGVIALARTLANEVAVEQIRVNAMVVFLASDEASSVTGTATSVDEGCVSR